MGAAEELHYPNEHREVVQAHQRINLPLANPLAPLVYQKR